MLRIRLLASLAVAVVVVGLVASGCTGTPIAGAQTEPTPQATATPEAASVETPSTQEDRAQVLSERAWLGIEIATAENGVAVKRVVPNGPAAAADLAEGDIITMIDGRDVTRAAELVAAVRTVRPGDAVNLTLRRGEAAHEVEVKAGALEEMPPAEVWPVPLPEMPLLGGWTPLPSGLEELQGIPPAEAFDHFRGGEFTFTDRDGREFTARLTPGKVVALSNERITIDPNGPAGEREFRVSDRTVTRSGGLRVKGLNVDDKVVVVSIDDADEAAMILKAGPPVLELRIPREPGNLERFLRQLPWRQAPRDIVPQPSAPGA